MNYYDALVWSRIIGILIFFGLFLTFVLWSYRPGGKRIYDAAARIPFEDAPAHGAKEI
ncbi:cbb3-type cytochrome oxidase subunit 3 [Zavarzinia sp.]|uniref:cbb3-type cytochrome oxidase subunit 3 n=1 Tax=Zavarzinia sp. TaxID=2027920 RepID=UPI003BB7A5A6|nr:cbb3-type cytochrome c oxidase subunit 3 [Zavarzinia sp.]